MIGKELKVYDGLSPIQQLNLYRNLYYNDGNATEHGIIANAINDILPVVRKSIGKEVIRALECCANGECDECPYQESSPCKEYLNNAALDIINRQRAEIEAWETGQKALQKNLSQIIKAEAIKEFAERVKEIKVKYALPLLGLQTKTEIENYVDDILSQMRDGIDRLAKEMTEGKQ